MKVGQKHVFIRFYFIHSYYSFFFCRCFFANFFPFLLSSTSSSFYSLFLLLMELIEILLKVFGREMPVIVLWIAVFSVRACRKFFLDFASGGFCELMS